MDSFRISDAIVVWVDGSISVCYNHEMIAKLEYEPTAQIRWIWVEPKYRRQGLAKLMLAEVERRTGLIAYPLPPVSDAAQGLFH